MQKKKSTSCGCKDVFHAFLVKDADYDGIFEIPCLSIELSKPNKLIPFSKALSMNDYDAWVHFYENDVVFERLWNHPKRYFEILKRFRGVITPDFSVYRDMPFVMQLWNIYRSRSIGHWLQRNGIKVIPNIRFGDERTFASSCAGVENQGVIAVGSYGCVKSLEERKYFKKGLEYVVNTLKPKTIVVYGSKPKNVFDSYENAGIEILQFVSEYAQTRKAVIN